MLLVLRVGVALPAGGAIEVSDAFESGSLGAWRVEDETRLIVSPRREFDQDNLNSALTWF